MNGFDFVVFSLFISSRLETQHSVLGQWWHSICQNFANALTINGKFIMLYACCFFYCAYVQVYYLLPCIYSC